MPSEESTTREDAPRPQTKTDIMTNSRNDPLDRIAADYAATYSDSLAVLARRGHDTTRLLSQVCKDGVEACAISAAHLIDLGHTGLTCRSPNDVVKLQTQTFDAVNAALDACGRIYSDLFETWKTSVSSPAATASTGSGIRRIPVRQAAK